MTCFLTLAVFYIGGWTFMFIADTFRWTFYEWTFFALISTASVVLMLISLILGIVCRLNFGQGLPRYRESRSS